MEIICVENREKGALEHCLESAKRAGFDITVLKNVNPSGYAELTNIYKHNSPNPANFELICLRRYLVIADYLRGNDVDEFFLIDSDVLIFKAFLNTINNIDRTKNFIGSYINSERDVRFQISPHASFWSRGALFDFVNYIFLHYKEENTNKIHDKIQSAFKKNKIVGGISDMTLLYLWAKDRNYMEAINLINKNGVVDHNITTGHNLEDLEYKTLFGFKDIFYIKGELHFKCMDGGYVPVALMHFQGKAKKAMKSVLENNIVGYIFVSFVVFYARNFRSFIKII